MSDPIANPGTTTTTGAAVHGVDVVAVAGAITATRAQRVLAAAATAFFLIMILGLAIADRVSPPGAHGDLVDEVVTTAGRTAPGLDRSWLFESPPPLPRHPVPPAMLAHWARLPRLEFLCHINEALLTRLWQKGIGLAAVVGPYYPREFDVFTVPDGGINPMFRYPPRATMPDGLTTNAFGFRGPDIAVDKPARTVRIACVGASTTVDSHHFAWSYPELMQHWLDRWAASRRLDVRFEVINAGREAIRSPDIRAIVEYEVLPLAVDYVVYYEGANQCGLGEMLRHVQVQGAFTPAQPPPEVAVDIRGLAAQSGPLLEGLHDHSVNGTRLLRIAGFGTARPEPAKPAQSLVLPAGFDEHAPDLARAAEILEMGTILPDLDAIHRLTEAAGARLVLCSFCWMVQDGLELDLAESRSIYSHLNVTYWPLRYAVMRRLTDLQNRCYATWARAHDVAFLDLAAQMPRDARLSIDAIHTTELGSRLRAWLTFAGLVRLLEADLQSGRLPSPDTHPDAQHPFLRPARHVTAAELDGR
jgi:hypothetical protein